MILINKMLLVFILGYSLFASESASQIDKMIYLTKEITKNINNEDKENLLLIENKKGIVLQLLELSHTQSQINSQNSK